MTIPVNLLTPSENTHPTPKKPAAPCPLDRPPLDSHAHRPNSPRRRAALLQLRELLAPVALDPFDSNELGGLGGGKNREAAPQVGLLNFTKKEGGGTQFLFIF